MQIYFSESKMSINNYKQLPRSKDTGKAITGMAAKASGSRGRGNPSKPNVSAAGSQATGVSNSGNQQVKNFSSNSILPYIIKTKRTPLNNVKVSNLNNKPLLSESTINCAQPGSNASDSNSPNSWKNSTNSHAQKGSANNESFQCTPFEPTICNSNSNANIQDCTIYGQSFFDCESEDNIDNEPIIVYPFLHDNNIEQTNELSLLQDDYVEDYEGNKRPIADLDDLLLEGRNEAKRNRGVGPPKLSYANCAKQFIMLEFRASNPKVQLRQEDYGHIEAKLAFAYATLPKPRPATIPKVQQMGLSQGALWCAAKDDFTYKFCMEHAPAFDTPPKYLPNPLLPPKPKPNRKKKGEKAVKATPDDPELVRQWEIPENQLVYTYQVFGPDNRPFRYLKGRFPMDFWTNHEDLIELIRAFHPDLDQDVTDKQTGLPRKYHMRVSAGMEDKTDIVGGYFTLSIEVEEELMPVLARLDGILQILSTSIKLVGGGIENAITALNTPDTDTEHIDDNILDLPDPVDPDDPNSVDPAILADQADRENNESLYNSMQEGDNFGNYMLEDNEDNEDCMDQTADNPSNPSSI